jgi:hypothetical protein
MRARSAGWKDKLASLKHVFPQFPSDRALIWQRPNAEFKSNPNVKSNFNPNPNVKTNPEQLNGVRVFFRVLCENYSDPI